MEGEGGEGMMRVLGLMRRGENMLRWMMGGMVKEEKEEKVIILLGNSVLRSKETMNRFLIFE